MKLHILGAGSANDPTLANSSSVVCGIDGTQILIDCGYSVAREVLAEYRDPDAIDAIYFTHHHPDHCYGFVPVMIGWCDLARSKPLVIATTKWGRGQLEDLLRLGVGGNWDPGFDIHWHMVPDPLEIGGLSLTFALTDHLVPNHAVRIEEQESGAVLAYSGDGRPTEASVALFASADLLMHECYVHDSEPLVPGHACLEMCLDVAKTAGVGQMMLYHIREDEKAAMARAVSGISGVEIAQEKARIDIVS